MAHAIITTATGGCFILDNAFMILDTVHGEVGGSNYSVHVGDGVTARFVAGPAPAPTY